MSPSSAGVASRLSGTQSALRGCDTNTALLALLAAYIQSLPAVRGPTGYNADINHTSLLWMKIHTLGTDPLSLWCDMEAQTDERWMGGRMDS